MMIVAVVMLAAILLLNRRNASLLLFACAALSGCGGGADLPAPPSGGDAETIWAAGPVIDGRDYSPGTVLVPNGQLVEFNIPVEPGSIHYVTRPGPLAGAHSIDMLYRVDLDPGAAAFGATCPGRPPSGVTVYLQRAGDDWSGAGKFEAFRWWATFATGPLAAGEHEIVAPLTSRWTAVETSDSITAKPAFDAAVANVGAVGFTFLNCTGYGHGASAIGRVHFTLERFIFRP